MKRVIILMALLIIATHLLAQKPVPGYQLVKSKNALQYKNFYLLTLLQELPQVRKMMAEDAALQRILKIKLDKAAEARKNCGQNLACYTAALKIDSGELASVGKWLSKNYKPNNALGDLVKQHLIPSGCYVMHTDPDPKVMLTKAWAQDAAALNHTIGVYVEGKKPNYPKIDSLGFTIDSRNYLAMVSANLYVVLNADNKLCFEPSLGFALTALELDGRRDAGDYEPMELTVNQSAIAEIKKAKWDNYKYSIILIPGEGPEDKETELSAGGILRCKIAAQQYEKGMAPFLMVSGGRVHPYKTKYNEAYEMKKYLIQTLNIPEAAILMEPHARHTTTNLRNAARLIFRYGIPMEKPAITSTIKSQSLYISGTLLERCRKELGYEPFKSGKRLTETEMEFYPLTAALQIDYDEPMDP